MANNNRHIALMDVNDLMTVKLPVMEQFYSIQGEGFHTGSAASFIRLAGCNIGCVWCDVKESWARQDHAEFTIDQILNKLSTATSKNIVITGGEPLMHDLDILTAALHSKGFKLWLETSGAYPVTGSFEWICVSPKKFKAALPEVLIEADELKVVIYNASDLMWAESFMDKIGDSCKLYMQPEYSRFSKVIPLITEYVKQYPRWNISLQTHKILGVR